MVSKWSDQNIQSRKFRNKGKQSITILHVGGPEGQVVSEELHDQCGVLVALLAEGIQLSDGIVEGLLGQMASTVGGVQDLVVEDGEVEGQSEANGVGRGQLGDGDIRGVLVGLEGLVRGLLALVAGGELGQVAVVVTLHLVVEDLGLSQLGVGDQVISKDLKDIIADALELLLDLGAVGLDHGDVGLGSLGLLLLLD